VAGGGGAVSRKTPKLLCHCIISSLNLQFSNPFKYSYSPEPRVQKTNLKVSFPSDIYAVNNTAAWAHANARTMSYHQAAQIGILFKNH